MDINEENKKVECERIPTSEIVRGLLEDQTFASIDAIRAARVIVHIYGRDGDTESWLRFEGHELTEEMWRTLVALKIADNMYNGHVVNHLIREVYTWPCNSCEDSIILPQEVDSIQIPYFIITASVRMREIVVECVGGAHVVQYEEE